MQFSAITLFSFLAVASAAVVETRQLHEECEPYSGGDTAYNFLMNTAPGSKLCCNYLGPWEAENCCHVSGPATQHAPCVPRATPSSTPSPSSTAVAVEKRGSKACEPYSNDSNSNAFPWIMDWGSAKLCCNYLGNSAPENCCQVSGPPTDHAMCVPL